MEKVKKTQDCMVCGKQLQYLSEPLYLKCNYCGKEHESYFLCEDGHYVCEECHKECSLRIITHFCLRSSSINPLEMADTIMNHSRFPMIGAEHHPMTAGVLVTAYKNLTGNLTKTDIEEAIKRGDKIPAGYCGLFGTDGAAIATGIATSVILKATPLSDIERIIANMMTSRALAAISNHRGPRCCKRSVWIALETAVEYFREVLKVELEYLPSWELKCEHFFRNRHCNKEDCRFYPEPSVVYQIASANTYRAVR
jgi:DNA-directed RNA polymerase subunit RPC12/RpoP